MSNGTANTSTHNNQATITCPLITSMTYNNESSITSGQPFKGNPTAKQNTADTWTVEWQCGRQNSAQPAQAFNEWVVIPDGGSAGSHEFAPGGQGATPNQLNFCFGMNVTFKVDETDVNTVLYFGQGSHGDTNNWWIGGNGLINLGNPIIPLIADNKILAVLAVSGSTSSFNLTTANAQGAKTAAG